MIFFICIHHINFTFEITWTSFLYIHIIMIWLEFRATGSIFAAGVETGETYFHQKKLNIINVASNPPLYVPVVYTSLSSTDCLSWLLFVLVLHMNIEVTVNQSTNQILFVQVIRIYSWYFFTKLISKIKLTDQFQLDFQISY